MNIHFTVEDTHGQRQDLEVPDDMSLSLMEALKAYEYGIPATCGGMALCATCHVEVLSGIEQLSPVNDSELDMLDTLPDATAVSRLACQLRVNEQLNGAVFRVKHEE